ncbi:carboxymuconolactone decarboxylase family protein [Bacillus sp. Marseille-P3661]|uniref:carboxymuconolactone decarboxylase family protein n=1 Tax=Bacillus sp. Marseille-P3661 TaxID=1936234 RepID=UPI000C85C049|nr:carboxymuconolactone decarboxylase family protein [Bacillus sp. Marseille-P3661]
MTTKVAPHWEIMEQSDPELYQKLGELRSYLTNNEIIPRKYKELMNLSMFCILRNVSGINTHAGLALNHGATKEEVFMTIAQTITIGGIPAYKEGIMATKELLEKEVE